MIARLNEEIRIRRQRLPFEDKSVNRRCVLGKREG